MRRNSVPPKMLAATAISLSVALALSACSGNGDSDDTAEDDHLIPQEDIDRLNSSMVEANDLAVELSYAASRLSRECMEDQGFTVHPEPLEHNPERMIQALPGTEVPNQDMIPETDEAAVDGVEMYDEWTYTMSDDYVNTEITSDPEWLELGREGADEYFHALHEQEPVDQSEMTNEEIAEELGSDETPEFGGCRGEAVELIYGEDVPAFEEMEEEEIKMNALPPLPGDINLDPWEVDFHTPELDEAKEEWSSCLEDRDRPSVSHVSALSQYVRSFYATDTPDEIIWYHGSLDMEGFIEPPEEAPWDFDEAKENEIAYITDLAECADETDVREARQQAWDQTLAEKVIDYEEEMYLWQEQVEAGLESAQEALSS